MSTKDLLDRLQTTNSTARKTPPAPEPKAPENKAGDTRVASGVVRRRGQEPPPPPPPQPSAPKTIRRPGAGDPPAARPASPPPASQHTPPSSGQGGSGGNYGGGNQGGNQGNQGGYGQRRSLSSSPALQRRPDPEPVRPELARQEPARPEPVQPEPEPEVRADALESREPESRAPEAQPEPEVRADAPEVRPEPEVRTDAAEARPEPAQPEARPEAEVRPAPRTTERPTMERAVIVERPTMERAVIVERPGLPPMPPRPGMPGRPGPGRPDGLNLPGLGRGVIALPPGYDPNNPTANRARPGTPPGQRWAPGGGPGPGRGGRPDGRMDPRGGPGPGMPGAPAPADQPNQPSSDPRRKARSKERAEVVLDEKLRRSKGRPTPGIRQGPKPPIKRKLRIDGEITVANLAHELGVKAAELVKMLMQMGQPSTINQFIDFDTATILASEYGAEIVNVAFDESELLVKEKEDDKQKRISRPPVVTVMGHVDHGKTTLLDTIRKSRVASSEAGGITQHIGAYQVKRGDRLITFIDTPGHAAFSAMRARGAKATDIVVLVVAADDGVMPQTVEAITHAKAANVPIVVAVNKCDKPGIQLERIRQELMGHGLVPEEYGGDTMFVNISALKGTGVEDLLDSILLVAEITDMKANPERKAEGVVLESRLEIGKGAVASLLIQNGTLRQGDAIVIGMTWGRVRAMMDDRGGKLKEAGPATPVEIFGLQDLPVAGDTFAVVESERDARSLTEHRQDREKASNQGNQAKRTMDDLLKMGAAAKEIFYVVLKTDVSGSLEALRGSLESMQVSGTQLKILHSGIGPINESDVNLAAAEKALIVAFNVKADAKARQAADSQNVEIRRYDIIYTVLDDIRARLLGMLAPVYEERRIGEAEIRAMFNISKIGQVAGCMVLDGKVVRASTVKVLRNGKQVHDGKVSGLKRFKDDVREVEKGFECGVSVEGSPELLVGDRLVFFTQVEVPRE